MPQESSHADVRELGRLRWRCRRGMKELDLLLSRYVDERFCGATSSEQAAFRRLLEAPDNEIYAYCLGVVPPPPALAELIEHLTRGPADRGVPTKAGAARC